MLDAVVMDNEKNAERRAFDAPRLKATLECLLFVAGEPVTAERAADALQLDEAPVTLALDELVTDFKGVEGLQVLRVAGGYQMRTRPEFHEAVNAFLAPPAQKLSPQALEALAIIAYRQPVTQPELDAIRSVNSDTVLNTLLDRGMIREAGRLEAPGRPFQYETTDLFLTHFSLNALDDLPPMEEFGIDLAAHLDLPRE